MSKFLDILDAHRELLTAKGYQGMGLGDAETPGPFMQQLETKLSGCMRAKREADFFVEGFCFFDNEKDAVNFKFHYTYDKVDASLRLPSVVACMDEFVQPFLLDRGVYQLPYASEVYRNLCLKRRDARIILPMQSNNQKPQDINSVIFQKIYQEHSSLLKEKGYLEDKLRWILQYGYLQEQLGKQLSKAMLEAHQLETPTYFILSTNGAFNNDRDTVSYELYYVYDPNSCHLDLRMLTATLNNDPVHYRLEYSEALPDAAEVYKRLEARDKLDIKTLKERYISSQKTRKP